MTAGAEQNSAGPTPTQQLEPREGQAKFDARRTHSVATSSDKPCAHVTTSRRRFPETEGTSASHVRNERFRAAPGSKHVGRRHGTGRDKTSVIISDQPSPAVAIGRAAPRSKGLLELEELEG